MHSRRGAGAQIANRPPACAEYFTVRDIDDRQLDRHANLRGGEPDTMRVDHGLAHVVGELPGLGGNRIDPGTLLPQNRISENDDIADHWTR